MSGASAPVPLPQQPLDSARYELLLRLVDGLDASALHWLSGFAAGLAAARQPALAPAPVAAPEQAPLATIVHGSQTGNGRRIAEGLAERLQAQGLAVRLLRAGEYPLRELARERRLFVVISTHGDGEPPDDARAFVDYLSGRRAPRLESLEFAVLALGDSSYPRFCATGRLVDERLAELGARRLFPRSDCDVDFEAPAAAWGEQVGAALEQARPALAPARVMPLFAVTKPPAWSRERPFAAEVLANQRITVGGDVRDVRHLELSLADAGIEYEPGDALGIVASNPPRIVAAVLEAAGLDGSAVVERDGRQRALADWLGDGLEITRLTRPLLSAVAARSGSAELAELLAPGREAALRALLERSQLIDLLRRYPANWAAPALVAALRPLAPRLYSIASSRREVGDEVHLTVARLDGATDGSNRPGAASEFLATRAEGETVPVYLEPNPRFRLPADGSRDVLMIGPGTGAAPFRAFVQERGATGASGRNWLVFGARHFQRDFLYQLEWQQALRRGVLDRIDLAFSRDGEQRVYVQHRLEQAGAEVHDWIEGGAYLYVCGDAAHMAPDVHAALAAILARHGGCSAEQAQERLERLVSEGRYVRDVY
ncbi:MAG: assimilatory sulfite reductase (NADPH) flavoprotein subunit [Gammaproteobacteria bacterium]|nr:assimilatory sulfite reductase (NADPH) flavoprotein subunit [Gammaproteobacteria bacterium]